MNFPESLRCMNEYVPIQHLSSKHLFTISIIEKILALVIFIYYIYKHQKQLYVINFKKRNLKNLIQN